MEHFIIFCCLPLKDLWTKGQFNLTSANFMAAKKAVTALWGERKKKKKELFIQSTGIKVSGKFQLLEEFCLQIVHNTDGYR